MLFNPGKKILHLSIITTMLAFSACQESNKQASEKNEANPTAADSALTAYFGDKITEDGAVEASQLPGLMSGKDSLKIKVKGKIEEVCQKKGCWLDMKVGNDQTMKVGFKDYAFFVPKDAAGKTVILEGIAYTDTIPVSELRHYAEDAGKTKSEIEKITSPQVNIAFEANGVIIQK